MKEDITRGTAEATAGRLFDNGFDPVLLYDALGWPRPKTPADEATVRIMFT